MKKQTNFWLTDTGFRLRMFVTVGPVEYYHRVARAVAHAARPDLCDNDSWWRVTSKCYGQMAYGASKDALVLLVWLGKPDVGIVAHEMCHAIDCLMDHCGMPSGFESTEWRSTMV